MAVGKEFSIGEEFAGLDFHSIRLEKRFIRTMETLIKQPDKSIWYSSEDRAEAKAIYRMLGNEAFDREEIAQAHRRATIRRMAEYGGTILAVQDTTGVNYDNHLKTEGIGYISDKTLGLNVHTCLAVTADGLVLGVLDQSSYNRPEAKDDSATHDSKKIRPIEEKESFRWLETLERSTADIPDRIKVVTVCDREGDMYEFFAKAASLNEPLLIRIVQNRMTVENKRILDEIQKKKCQGRVGVTIPRDSRNSIPEREAVLQLRYAQFAVKRPHILNPVKSLPDSVTMNIIYVKEEHPPKGNKPIEWFLATTEPVTTPEEAYEKVGYYIQRWKIERFHYVLKSGCVIEKLQERSVERTTTLILMYSVIAVMILSMTYAGRLTPDLPCSMLLEKEEWELLFCVANKTKTTPESPYSVAEAITYLGQLGGPKRAPSDGPPGVKTIWIGLMKLYTLLAYREFL
ncbi:IS4 family transposase [Spirochaetia bacterium]|nr:IS4 family transposase [Spirochaetia bacterium]